MYNVNIISLKMVSINYKNNLYLIYFTLISQWVSMNQSNIPFYITISCAYKHIKKQTYHQATY